MKACQLPPFLQPGDDLWVTMPSGTLRERQDFDQGVSVLRSQHYIVHLSPNVTAQWGYLAGTDSQRRQSLTAGFKGNYTGIFCGRGGYGGARLLEEWEWPPSPPKWLVGFSDVTALLWGLATQGVASVHGPVMTTLAQEPDWSQQRLFDWLAGRPIPALTGKGWGQGKATGILLPGNLTVATHILGTPLCPNLDQVILALEDVGEAPYRLDRMLTQWRMSGVFKQVKGIALGRFSDCNAPAGIPSLTVEEVLRDRLGDLGIPIVSDLPFGHGAPNAALPVGIPTQLDGDQGLLTVGTP
ncbi:S66 peptidase family protein [Acaryochloris marina NIES-2412]|uniref:S66 peptidase family protein n=1 Tax=Acaryochloris marina TaxID=155978 RepID=UPI00405A1CCF